MKIIIIGAGGFATVVKELAQINGFDEIAFLDDDKSKARCGPVIGTFSDIKKMKKNYKYAIVALGNNRIRDKMYKKLVCAGFSIPSLIHPTAVISKSAKIGNGCIIRELCSIGPNAVLGNAVILNASSIIDHDCIVGDSSHLLIGAIIRNEKKVPSLTLIKANIVVE